MNIIARINSKAGKTHGFNLKTIEEATILFNKQIVIALQNNFRFECPSNGRLTLCNWHDIEPVFFENTNLLKKGLALLSLLKS